MEDAVTSWLVCASLDRGVSVQALAKDLALHSFFVIVLCSLA